MNTMNDTLGRFRGTKALPSIGLAAAFLILGTGCAEQDAARKEAIDALEQGIRETESSTIVLPPQVSNNWKAANSYNAWHKSQKLVELFQSTCAKSKDLAAPTLAMDLIPKALDNLAASSEDEEVRRVINSFSQALKDHKRELDSFAAGAVMASGDPNAQAGQYAVQMSIDALFASESIKTRYRDANEAAAASASVLKSRYGVDFAAIHFKY